MRFSSYYKIYRDFLFFKFIFIRETPVLSGLLLLSLPMVEVLKFFSKGGLWGAIELNQFFVLVYVNGCQSAKRFLVFLQLNKKYASPQTVPLQSK